MPRAVRKVIHPLLFLALLTAGCAQGGAECRSASPADFVGKWACDDALSKKHYGYDCRAWTTEAGGPEYGGHQPMEITRTRNAQNGDRWFLIVIPGLKEVRCGGMPCAVLPRYGQGTPGHPYKLVYGNDGALHLPDPHVDAQGGALMLSYDSCSDTLTSFEPSGVGDTGTSHTFKRVK